MKNIYIIFVVFSLTLFPAVVFGDAETEINTIVKEIVNAPSRLPVAVPLPEVYEVLAEYCLSDAAFQAAKADRTVSVFSPGSDTPTKDGDKFITDSLRSIPAGAVIVVEGHTDSIPHSGNPFGSPGDLDYQQDLSVRRAKYVGGLAANYNLIVRSVTGFGRTKPLVPLDPNHKGESENRRVTVKVVDLPSCEPREFRIWVSVDNSWDGPAPRGTMVVMKQSDGSVLMGTTGTHYYPKGDFLILDKYGEPMYLDVPGHRETAEVIAWKLPDGDWVFAEDLGIQPLLVCSRSPYGEGTNLLEIGSRPRVISDSKCTPCEDCP